MGRFEITCQKCHQLNVRYSGWAALLNPRWPRECTVCRAELVTGSRTSLDKVHGTLMWAALYLLHMLVGVGLLTLATALVWPTLINQPVYVRVAPMLCGAMAGLFLAELSRRGGTLLGHPKERKVGRGK